MHKIGFILAPLAVLAGILGFFLRRIQLETVFDPQTGLATPNAPVSLILLALSALVIGLFFGLSFLAPKREGADFATAFGSGVFGRTILCVFAGILVFAGGGRLVALVLTGQFALFPLLWAGAAVLGGLFLVILALLGSSGRNVAIPSAMPVFFISLWMVILYIDHAANPVLLAYVYRLFALGFLLLSLYYIAGFAFRQAKVGRLTFAVSTAVYFTGVTFADGGITYQNIALAALTVTALSYLLILTHKLSLPVWDEPIFDQDEAFILEDEEIDG